MILLWLVVVTSLTSGAAQRRHAPSYSVKVEHQPALTVITFMIDDGAKRVNLPRTIVGGQRFFGTVTDDRGVLHRDAYSLRFGDYLAEAATFSWIAPNVETVTHVPLVLTDWSGQELARTDVTVTPASEKTLTRTPGFPGAIQSGHAAPYSGSFDGFGWTTTVTIAGQKVLILAQTVDESIVLVPAEAAGPVPYSVKTAAGESTGEVRCVRVQETLAKTSKHERLHYNVVISGLEGLNDELGFFTQNYTPIIADLGPLLPVPLPRARPDVQEQKDILFVEPGDVPANGILHAEAWPRQVQPGLIDIRTELVMPRDELEEMNLLLQAPRRSWFKTPDRERAERLHARYGDRTLELLDNLVHLSMNPELAIGVMEALDLDRATPLILADVKNRLAHVDFEILTRKITAQPSDPNRQLLHDAALQELLQRPSLSAATAVALTGSPADLPSLENLIAEQTLHPMIQDDGEAAMAKFGDAKRWQEIATRLKLVITQQGEANVQEFQRGARQAALAGDVRFIPLLCRHVKDPSWNYGDYSVSPASSAFGAIQAIEDQQPGHKHASNPCEDTQ